MTESPDPIPSAAGRGLLAGLLVVGLWGAAGPAGAACDPVAPGSDNIVCSGVDADGYVASAGEDITVQGLASVENGGVAGVDALSLATGVRLEVVGGGQVSASGAGSAAIRGPDDLVILVRGTLQADGGAEGGILAGANADITLQGSVGATPGGSVDVSADDAVGIELQDGSLTLENGSQVTVTGADTVGVRAVESTVALNGGSALSVVGDRATGIDAGDAAKRVQVDGELSVDGADAVGVDLGNDAVATTQVLGELTVAGDGAVGIRSAANAQIIESRGSITLEGSAVGGAAIDHAGGTGPSALPQITNRGSLTIEADGAFGIRVADDSRVDNEATGVITVTGAGGVGIAVDALGDVDNRGTIDASGDGAIGVDLGAGGGNGSVLTNDGTITGGAGAGVAVRLGGIAGGEVRNRADAVIAAADPATGTAIQGGVGNDVVTNEGLIEGATLLGDGDDRFVLEAGGSFEGGVDGGSDVTLDVFELAGSGEGALALGAAAMPAVTGFELLSVTSGAWTVGGEAGWSSGLRVEAGSLRVQGGLAVAGDLTLEDGATVVVVLDATAPASGIDVAGSASIGENGDAMESALLEVELAEGEDATLFADGEVLTVLTVAGGLSGAFETITLPDPTGLLSFTELVGAQAIEVRVDRADYADLTTSTNGGAVARYVDTILGLGPTGDLAVQLAALDQLDAADVDGALTQLDGEAYEAHSVMALAVGQRFGRLLTDRPLVCGALPEREEGPITPCGERGWEPWADLLVLVGENDGSGRRIDFDYKGGGLALGADYRLREGLAVGVALGASATRTEIDARGDGVLSSVDLGLRGEARRGPFGVRAAFDYGHGWHTSERDLRVGTLFRQGDADFESHRIGLRGEASYEQRLGVLRLQPLIGVDFTWLQQGAIDESGAADLSLRVAERTDSLVAGTVGLRVTGHVVRYSFLPGVYEWGDGVWTPELAVRYRRTFSDADRSVEAAFAGAPDGAGTFVSEAEGQENEVDLGLALHYQPTAGMTLSARYDLLVGDIALDHVVGVDLRIPF